MYKNYNNRISKNLAFQRWRHSIRAAMSSRGASVRMWPPTWWHFWRAASVWTPTSGWAQPSAYNWKCSIRCASLSKRKSSRSWDSRIGQAPPNKIFSSTPRSCWRSTATMPSTTTIPATPNLLCRISSSWFKMKSNRLARRNEKSGA